MTEDFWGSHDLVASCLGAVVQAWNPFSNPSKHATLPDHYGQSVNSVRWTYNSKVLACGGDRGTVSLYNNGSYLGGLPGALDKNTSAGPSMDAIQCLRITKDSKRLIAGCRNRLIFVWDLKTQSIRGTISHHKAAISSLFLSPDDNILASSSVSGDVLLHQLSTSSKLGHLPVEDNKAKRSLSFTPCDPTLLAAASEDGSVYVWNIKSLTVVTMLKHKHPGGAMGVQLSPSQPQIMYTAGMDKRVVVWDRRSEQEAQSAGAASAYTCLCIRDDALHLAAGTQGGTLMVYDVRKLATPVARLSDNAVPAAPVIEVHWKRSSSSRRSSISQASVPAASGAQSAASSQVEASTAAGPQHGHVSSSASSRSAVPRVPTSGAPALAVASLALASAHVGADSVSAVFSPVRSTPLGTPMQIGQTPSEAPSPMVQQMNISPVPMSGLSGNSIPTPKSSIPPGIPLPKSPRIPLPMPPPSRQPDFSSAALPMAPAVSAAIPLTSNHIMSESLHSGGRAGMANGGSTAGPVVSRTPWSDLPSLSADLGTRGLSSGGDVASGRPSALLSVPSLQAGLSEEVFKAYMDQATANMNSTIQNLHVDLLRQFTIQQLRMQSRFDDMAARQDSLQAQVTELQNQLEQFIHVQRWGS